MKAGRIAFAVALWALSIALAGCRSTSSDEWQATRPPGGCVGMPPVEPQVTVRVVEKTTGAPLAGATIRFLDKSASAQHTYEDSITPRPEQDGAWKQTGHDVETDARGEVRLAANAVRIGVLVRKGDLCGAWSPKTDAANRIPEEITIALEPAKR